MKLGGCKRLHQSSIADCFKPVALQNKTGSKMSASTSQLMKKGDDRSSTSDSGEKVAKKHKISCETSMRELNRLPSALTLPRLTIDDPSHTVFVDPQFQQGKTPLPCIDKYVDKWDNVHVRMPCSSQNSVPVSFEKGVNRKFELQWNIVKRVLQVPMQSAKDLEDTIKAYNPATRREWNFTGLHYFVEKILDDKERKSFFTDILPFMANLVLETPNICPQPIPLLKRQSSHMLTLSQKQIACLLANAFFCTFPGRNYRHMMTEYKNFPSINFSQMYEKSDRGMSQKVAEKLRCILHYFKRIAAKEPDGCVTFHRQCLKKFPKWEEQKAALGNFHITSDGMIEKDGTGMLQLDFADKYIGGLLFTHGLVQEEIRFVICPELIISRLFTEVLDANECIIVTGCEQFSTYTGYANTFKWTGDFVDTTRRDEWNRRCTQVLAIDATRFNVTTDQYSPQALKREIEKAYCGFWTEDLQFLSAVATGNWGCGIFRGDPHLKSLLQWIAASVAGRDLCYFTFHDRSLSKDITNMFDFLRTKEVTVGKLWKLLLDYNSSVVEAKGAVRLYEFIYKSFGEAVELFYNKKPRSPRGRKKFH